MNIIFNWKEKLKLAPNIDWFSSKSIELTVNQHHAAANWQIKRFASRTLAVKRVRTWLWYRYATKRTSLLPHQLSVVSCRLSVVSTVALSGGAAAVAVAVKLARSLHSSLSFRMTFRGVADAHPQPRCPSLSLSPSLYPYLLWSIPNQIQ